MDSSSTIIGKCTESTMAVSDSDAERNSVNHHLKAAISRPFKERVDPSHLNDALSPEVRLTVKQEEEMNAKKENKGRWEACNYLFSQLVKKTDWFKHLLTALYQPHLGMEDFADFCKQKEVEIRRHTGYTTTDGDEPDYDDAMSLPYPKKPTRRGTGRPRGKSHDSTQSRTIQHGKTAVSSLQNENYYNTVYEHFIDRASSLRQQEPLGARRGEGLHRTVQHGEAGPASFDNEHYYSSIGLTSSPARHDHQRSPRALPTPPLDDDGYLLPIPEISTSQVRPNISSREGVSQRSSKCHRETTTASQTHVARDNNAKIAGQPLGRAATSLVRPACTTSDDNERIRLSRIYPDTFESGVRSGFRSQVTQPSSDCYNRYPRMDSAGAQTPVSRDANEEGINHTSGNSGNFSLRPTTSSRENVSLRSTENSCRVDDRSASEDVSRSLSVKGPRRQTGDDLKMSPHRGERKQIMSQYDAPSGQLKTYSDLPRGELFRPASESSQGQGETDFRWSKGEGQNVLPKAKSNMQTTNVAKGAAAGGDFTREEVDTELANFPCYTPNITDDEVKRRMQRCKDSTYILWYCDSEQRPMLGVKYNTTFMSFPIMKRSSYNGTKFYIDRNQKDGFSLTELLKYHLEAGIKDTRKGSFRQKITLKYPFLDENGSGLADS